MRRPYLTTSICFHKQCFIIASPSRPLWTVDAENKETAFERSVGKTTVRNGGIKLVLLARNRNNSM